MMPSVWLTDFSGCRCVLACIRLEIVRPVQSPDSPLGNGVVPFGQRSGSVMVLNACTFALEIWKSDGARKPLPHVPRAANVSSGCHLNPTFGVVALPKSL